MTTPDDGQAKPSSQNTRLIEDLREIVAGKHNTAFVRSCAQQAIETIERLRGVEADAKRIDWLATQFRSCTVYMDGNHPYSPTGADLRKLRGPTFRAAIDAAIAASRSTGAADVGENHG